MGIRMPRRALLYAPASTQVVIVDEIGNAKEVAAVKSIAQRGVVTVRREAASQKRTALPV